MKKISKKLLTIIIAAVAVVLVAAIGLTVFFVTRETEDTSALERSDKIYWNINRLNYFDQGEGGVSSRQISLEDGFFHILFSVDGRPTERRAKKASVVNKIDDNDAMGLVIDEKTRSITDVIPLEEMGAYFLYRRVYVKSIDTKKFEIVANSSATLGGKDVKIKIKSTTPVIDVSTQAMLDAGMPVKFESIEEKDQVSVIMKGDEVYGLYITKRSANLKVYWNLERQYDKAYGVTKRTPDADGVYHILTACGGEQVEILCKDKSVVNKIDSTLCCGFAFDDDGYAIEHISVSKCTGGKSIASWFSVDEINESNLSLHKYVQGANDSNQDKEISLSKDCEIYNVSKNYKVLQGEADEVQVGDTIQAYSDSTSKAILLYVVNRYKGGEIWWNVYRSWNTVTLQSNRKRKADGYYHFIMAKDGKVYDYKVASKELADMIDSIPARTMTLTIEGDFIVGCESASGINYRSVASWYTITSLTGPNTFHALKTSGSYAGSESDVTLADDCKIYNVSEMYEDHLGEETSLRVGDVIQCWADYKGNAKYIYVISRNYSNAVTAHRGTHNCSDCGSNITWQPWTSATSLPTTSGHYYLCGNVVSPQANVGENQNVVLCLNGYSVRAAGTRLYSTFYNGSSLHIHDCVGTGKMYSKYQGNLDGIFGGILYARRGNISINGGTYEAPEQEIPGNGGVIYVADNLKLSVRNAKIIGGNVGKNGGAIFSSNGILSIHDSTVKSGKAEGGKGDAIYLTSKSKLTIGGKVVIDGSNNNLYLSSSSVTLDEKEPLTEGSHIGVTTISATGKVTTNYINGSGCEKYFTSDTPDRVVTVSGAIFMSKINPTEAHDSHTCKECGEGVTWTPLTNPNELPTESGHYYLCGDISVNAQITIAADKDIVICLNGHNIKSTARRIYAVSGANSKLTVMDCKNKGKLFNSTTKDVYNSDSYNGRIIVVGANSTLNLFGVTVESPSYKSPLISGGAINVNKGGTANIEDSTIIGGPVGKNGGAVNAYGSLSLKNANITSGKADGNGDALYIGSDATFTIEGKVKITGGSKQVYINKDGHITLGGPLTSGSHIGIACGDNIVKITSNYYKDAEKYFENQRDNGKIVKQGDAVCFKVAAPAHNENHACVDCGNSVEWQPWLDSSSVPTTSGHYYLCYDVTVSGQKTVAAGEDVVICLNGHNIKSTARRVYLVQGAGARLTVCDCVGGGKIYNSTTTNTYNTDGQGRIILVGSGGTLNAYNVQMISPKYSSDINGGVLSVSSNGTINLKDCYIKGDKVGKNGGAIYLGPNAKLSLCDVDIVSGTADKGDAIYASGSAKITLSGNVNIEDGKSQVYLDGSLMKFDGELAGNGFTVTTTHIEGQISENYVAGAENIIKSADENLTVKVNSGALYLIDESAPPPTPAHEAHTCKECGESVTWTAWTSTETLPTDSGHYYLTDDVTVNGQKTVGAGKDVVICLNGHDITSTARRVYLLNGTGAKLTLMDCKESGTVSNSVKTDVYAKDGHGRIILVSANTTLNIFDITVKSPEFKSGVNGGTIGINKNGTCNIEDATVIGGPIGHNTESNDGGKGGAIFVSTSATLNLKNVNIVSGKADVNGDAIYAGSGAKVNVSGKVKIDNETNQVYLSGALIHFDGALTDGSGMLVNTSSADGKVSDNYVTGAENYIQSGKSGYVVNAKDGALYLEEDSGEPVVTGHTHLCKQCGSDVTFTEWTETTSLPKTSGHYYLTEDVVTNAQTSIGKDQDVTICLNGHNISCTARRPFGVTGENSVLTLCDCAGGGTITNTAKGDNYTSNDNGRIILVSKNATLNVYDVTLKAPTYKSANVYGGVISISNGGTTNISGAKIVGGEIGGNGGAITVIGGGKLTLCDTEIVAGKSDKGTDGIYCAKNAIIEVSGKIKITGDATHIYLNGTYIHFADVLTEGSKFNVDTADADGKVSDNYAEGAESYIKSAKTGFSVVYKDGAIYLESSKGKMMSIKTANEQKNANLSILSPALNLLKETK